MLTATVMCPGCSGSMPLTGWTAGRQLRCPRCKATFRLGSRPGDAELVLGQTTSAPAPTPRVAATPAVAAASPPVAAPGGGQRVTLILAAIGGLLLFVGGTIGLAVIVSRLESSPARPVEPPTVAQNTPVTPPVVTPPVVTPPIVTPPVVQPVVQPPNPGMNPVPNPVPPVGPVRRLTPELQGKVDVAIDKGVEFLLRYVNADGSLSASANNFQNGLEFLVGLTLLECGIPANHPKLAALSERVRTFARKRGYLTYEVSLAILYLDRLGDPADKPLIQGLGLQLLAGQQFGGGWGYESRAISPESEKQLLLLLERTRPRKAGELILRDQEGRLLDLSGRSFTDENLSANSIKGVETAVNKLQAIQEEVKASSELKLIPSLRSDDDPGTPRPKGRAIAARLSGHGPGDNSNTQFGALGLWAASRHGVPCERALALTAARFRTSQSNAAGWGYMPGGQDTPSMTCVGLLALAIGHGVRVEDGNERREDAQIQKGLTALSRNLKSNAQPGLYFMWSLERVGMLFNLEKVGETDWYEWGAKKLVVAQKADGSWPANSMGEYHGTNAMTDTCFALLFLRKTNLVRDLSDKLEQILDIKGSR